MSAPQSSSNTTINQTPANSFFQTNFNHSTGNNRLLIFRFTMSNARTYTSCTYGGVAMTQLYQINRGGLSQRMAFFYLENPPTGTNILRINFNGSVWNPISVLGQNFNDCGGIGNYLNTGGTTTPNTQNLTVSQDSLILISSCSINTILTQQIPTGTNKPFVSHNTNRQVSVGAISSSSGENAGIISLRATCSTGSITLDRVEIKGLGGSVGTQEGDFFLMM